MKLTRGDAFAIPLMLGRLGFLVVSIIDVPARAAEGPMPKAGQGSAWAVQQFHAEGGTDSFFNLAEDAWELGAEYLVPIQSHRRITIMTLQVARAWRFSEGLELQAGGGLFQSNGIRTDVPAGVSSDSTATGVSAGGGIRYQLVHLAPVSLFVDGSLQILLTPEQPFPAGGSGINGFLRGGLGLSCDLTSKFAVEVVYHVAHVSNASGVSPQNPGWTGQGGELTLRYRLPR